MNKPVPTTFMIEEYLLDRATELSKKLEISRSEFFRQAIQMFSDMQELHLVGVEAKRKFKDKD